MPELPEGFKLDNDAPMLPEGFKLDEPKLKEGSALDYVYEPLKTAVTGAAGSIAGGLEGLARLPFQGLDKAVEEAKKTQEYFSQMPETEQGRKGLELSTKAIQALNDVANFAIGGTSGLANLALNPSEGMQGAQADVNAIRDKGFTKALGQEAFNETGSPLAATAAEIAPDLASTLFGGGVALKGTNTAADAVKLSPTKLAIIDKIKSKSGDIETAKYNIANKKQAPMQQVGSLEPVNSDPFTRLSESIRGRKETLVKDPIAVESMKQGFDEGVVAAIKASGPEDRAKMLKMVDIMEGAKKNARYAVDNRPSDILGDSLTKRIDHIMDVNKNAGRRLEGVAKSLKGQSVDYSQPVSNFITKLEDMGIKIGQDFKPDFMGSDIEGLSGVEGIINKIMTRMSNTKIPDAYDVHRLKKYIDENVSYGKQVDGLTGKTEGVLKSLRRELDGVLDAQFPKYNEVNTVYSDTITTIDKLKDSIGKRIDLDGLRADKALGTELRKLMSNYQTRINLLDSIDAIDGTVKKYKSKNPFASESKEVSFYTGESGPMRAEFNDDLLVQALFADELNNIFGTTARTSFAGETAKGVKQGMQAATGGTADAMVGAAAALAEKARGINQDNAFKAIRQLLKEKQ